MLKAEREELRALLGKATNPGKGWRAQKAYPPTGEYEILAGIFRLATLHYDYGYTNNAEVSYRAQLIPAAVNALGPLLDALDRAEVENERLLERLACKLEDRDTRLETAEATIARLTAPVTEEEADSTAANAPCGQVVGPGIGYDEWMSCWKTALTAFIEGRKGDAK